ncbi:hypothetical protein A8F94_12085 [Bacillus sp. FJAT-27225]|uniref:PadR family transcriptional regulator n=1 Tax=Bacillus sp. FJAT-27225 TaxID=1743144 RepID=UPI00080C2F7F|nr:PadR family transcriptional regulator [Bacillus sp. FJAT-27225]OCA85613.1 hypothetical protein A8F94_12085 [Bacillus sp. FJAT-27225]
MSIEHSILAVISFKPSSGYDIKAEFEHKGAGLYWGMSYGSIYPKLKKLEEHGLIVASEANSAGRKKTLYELTGEGWRELEKWLAEPPEYPVIKDELFMKIAAWHEEMDSDVLIAHLKARKAKSKELLDFVIKWPENNQSFVSGIGKLGILYVKTKLEAEIKWIDDTIAALEQKDIPEAQDPSSLGAGIKKRRRNALQGEKNYE